MSLFKPPQTNYKNYYEQGAFELTWRYNMFMTFTYPLLILAGSLVSSSVTFAGFMCWLTPVSSLLVLKLTKRYEFVAYAQVILGSSVAGIILNLNLVHFHVVEVVFMMISVLFAFLTLRRKIGMISLLIQIFWISLFAISADYVHPEPGLRHKMALLLALIVALSLFGFLIIEFLQLRKTTEGRFVEINRDLTEVNHLVNSQSQEKTVMLKEIHHRVKNNLQVISSLLRLQSYEIEEEASRVHFQDAINRVSAMALIHEKMYQNENLSQIDLKNYIESLASDLVQIHARDINIKLNINSEIKELGNDSLVPVALILNELMTNSLKHAFDGKQEGIIEVSITKAQQPDYFSFVYKDGGEWKSSLKGTSFGLELIATLTEQLDGEVNRSYDNGTKYEFKLKNLR
jgi:two-component system, sensor histidine kinase PdtaS